MMSLQIRRLNADYKEVLETFKKHKYIKLIEAQGEPPSKYIFEIHVTSLVPTDKDSFGFGSVHQTEVFLPLDYPRRPPFCRMLTPVFHPNIDPQKICIGDHWSAAQSLPQLIIRIAEMLCYQSYNTKSPLNAKAAAWAEHNFSRLPLQKVDLTEGL
jgi:ubiquitin-protein ligase